MSPAGTEVVVPPRTSQRRIEAALARHADWIARTRRRLDARPRLDLERPDALWLDGILHAAHERQAARAGVRATASGVEVAGPDAGTRRAAVERWYRRQARTRLGALVEAEAGRLGLTAPRLSIRAQRTRWGACSPSRRAITLNWRLILGPPEVQRYVVVHELCHLRRADHSPAFWALVAAALPAHAETRQWLRRHGDELLAHRPLTRGT